ncbi:hypothetical protein EKN56_05980 [Limnobaculum zhutongyuii]|uniref:DUF2190 family protein n=1 Tax=Limnobaculum zhutongyuii TaxID=2498113 RepID=A0A411WIH2_9GAMM|nr:hypothetical protein [Limnobaculum zhutongyuii]QBH95989.1 hypothetical protein EKN56_05980 [Limnobaculum zhutongyuii]TQS89300.1 hypothetical protein ELQ32_05940 [Limnobaculum zhutongyuii]
MGDRNTWIKDGVLIAVPVDAGALIHAGNIVCVKSSGFATEGGDANTTAIGMAHETVDNSTGTAGERAVVVMRGKLFFLANDSAAPVTGALIGKSCYLLNSVTATATATGHPVAGKVFEVNPDGVWVLIA